MRGSVVLNRPVVATNIAPPRGNTVPVESNLFKVSRSDSNVSFFTYFLQWSANLSLIEKHAWIRTLITETSFLLSESADRLYAADQLEVVDSDDQVTLIPGGETPQNEIPTLDIWRMAARTSEGHICKDGSVDCTVGDLVINVKLHVIVEKPHWAVSVRQVGGFDTYWKGKSLHDLFLACEKDLDVLKNILIAQPGKAFKVECCHYGADKVIPYTICGFTTKSTAKTQNILVDGNEISVAEYFASKWSYKLIFPDTVLAVDVRGRYVPLELAILKRPVRQTLLQSVSHSELLNAVMKHEFFEFLSLYGVSFEGSGKSMTTKGRPLTENVRKELRAMRLLKFCLVVFVDQKHPLLGKLAEGLTNGPEKVEISHKIFVKESGWEKDLERGLANIKSGVDLFVVVSQSLPENIYRDLKIVFDLKLKAASQFLSLSRFETSSEEPQYWPTMWTQIALKVGPKITQARPSGTVVMGIDTAPIPGTQNKVITVSTSVENSMCLFSHQVRVCARGKRFDMEETLYETLLSYFFKNSIFPNRCIVYSKFGGDFKLFELSSDFLRGAHAAASRINRELRTGINPRIGSGPEIRLNWTLIYYTYSYGVALHAQTAPVVVNQSIVNGKGWEFYIQSGQGKRTTRYLVAHDTNNFTQAELENFTHQICNSFCRLPRPIKNSTKAIQRALLYIDSERATVRNASADHFSECMNQKLFSPGASVFLDTKASYE